MSEIKFSLTLEKSEGSKTFYTCHMAFDQYGYSTSQEHRERFTAITASTVGRTAGQAIRRAAEQVADRVDCELEWDEILKEPVEDSDPVCHCGHMRSRHHRAAGECSVCTCVTFQRGP